MIENTPRIALEGGRAILYSPATPQILAACKLLEGHRVWSKDHKSLRFEASAYNLGLMQNAAGAVLETGGGPETEVADHFAPTDIPSGWQSKTAPMDHQIEAEKFIDGKNTVALFMETGTGKTKVFIDWCNFLWRSGKITGVMVLSKKGAHRQWIEEEFPKHYEGEFFGQFWPFKNMDEKLLSTVGPLKVISFNWDGFKTKNGFLAASEFAQVHRGRMNIAADESQEIKSVNSQRHKKAKLIKPASSHRALLSGTPIAVDLTDEWAQLNWLDDKILGMRYISTFRSVYCRMGGFQNRQVIGHNNVEDFRRKTAPYVFRVTKEEIGIIPPIEDNWRFDLTADQKRMIQEIKRDLETNIDDDTKITVPTVLASFVKMSQIASGFMIDENKSVHRIIPVDKNPRAERMLEWLDWVGDNRSIVWHRFREDRKIILEVLEREGIPYIDYASMSDAEFKEHKDEFRRDGGRLVLLGNPQSGLGTGQNLQGACNHALYYSHSDRMIDRLQSQDRIRRIGTKGIVTFSNLVAKSSPDVRVISNNARKKGISDMALSDLRSLLREIVD